MEKVCAMGGVIFSAEKPGRSIRQLREAGIGGIMFDFGLFVSPEWVFQERGKKEGEREMDPARMQKCFDKASDAFDAHDFLPAIARLPFVSPGTEIRDTGLNSLVLEIDTACIRACERMGIREIIVQPLFTGIERDDLWEANRAFFLALSDTCEKEETRILLINQCRSQSGRLSRGICSDGVQAARWVDALNREAGQERFGFCLDMGICNLCRQDIQGMVLSLGSRIRGVILTENDGEHMARLLPFTSAYMRQSTMDWLGLIRGLRRTGFDGFLILETTDTTVAFSPLLQPSLAAVYSALLDYFALQIGIENDLKKYEKIVLFGAGNMCRNYMKCYGEKYPPLFTCDNNPKLWGSRFEGLEVKNPEELRHLPGDWGVIICNMFYREIEAQLRSMGIENIGYFNDEYMPSFYFDRLKRDVEDEEEA